MPLIKQITTSVAAVGESSLACANAAVVQGGEFLAQTNWPETSWTNP
jgi:hypothetical protein